MSPFDPVGRYPRLVLEAKDPVELGMYVWMAEANPAITIRVMPVGIEPQSKPREDD